MVSPAHFGEPNVSREINKLSETTHNLSTSSTNSPRPGSMLIWTIFIVPYVGVKRKIVRVMFSLCNHENAVNFLDAMRSKRIMYLLDVQSDVRLKVYLLLIYIYIYNIYIYIYIVILFVSCNMLYLCCITQYYN